MHLYKIFVIITLLIILIPPIIYYHSKNSNTEISEELYTVAGGCIIGQVTLSILTAILLLVTPNHSTDIILSIILLGLSSFLIYTMILFNKRNLNTSIINANLVINYVALISTLVYAITNKKLF